MRYLIFMLICFPIYSYTLINETYWCTGKYKCSYTKQEGSYGGITQDATSAMTYLPNQFGYQGIELTLGASHIFYAYNGSGSNIHIFKAKLCDMENNCFNYQKEVRLRIGEFYGETIYSSLQVLTDKVGSYPITASTFVDYYPIAESKKTAMLGLKPFPYDH